MVGEKAIEEETVKETVMVGVRSCECELVRQRVLEALISLVR
jgi:hypothetical protein